MTRGGLAGRELHSTGYRAAARLPRPPPPRRGLPEQAARVGRREVPSSARPEPRGKPELTAPQANLARELSHRARRSPVHLDRRRAEPGQHHAIHPEGLTAIARAMPSPASLARRGHPRAAERRPVGNPACRGAGRAAPARGSPARFTRAVQFLHHGRAGRGPGRAIPATLRPGRAAVEGGPSRPEKMGEGPSLKLGVPLSFRPPGKLTGVSSCPPVEGGRRGRARISVTRHAFAGRVRPAHGAGLAGGHSPHPEGAEGAGGEAECTHASSATKQARLSCSPRGGGRRGGRARPRGRAASAGARCVGSGSGSVLPR